MLLRLDQVGKHYGAARPVLTDINLTLAPGEATGILGANGSGKSTLLRLLADVSAPSSGTIAGHPTRAYVPDRFPARQRMSALSYLCHMGRIRGMTTTAARTRGGELLSRLALEGGPDSSLRELSKGNAQKVGLAQALLVVPQLLVLDEPWSGLDFEAREALTEVITETVADGTSVVFTDHRPDFLRAVATNPYRLEAGVLDPLERIDQRYAPQARILLSPTENASDVHWPGIIGIRYVGRNVEIRTSVFEREAVLLAAIRDGWSVLCVTSDDPAAERSTGDAADSTR